MISCRNLLLLLVEAFGTIIASEPIEYYLHWHGTVVAARSVLVTVFYHPCDETPTPAGNLAAFALLPRARQPSLA